MSGRRISKRYFLVFFLVFSLVFSPIDLFFFANSSSAESADLMIEADTEWSGVQTISGYASVASGITLTIKKGAVIEFEGQSTLDVSGSLVVEGTPSEPVVFRKKNSGNPDDSYSITSSGNIYARNIDVSGGGSISEVFMVEKNRQRLFFQYVNAFWMYSGAFGAQGGGTLDIEGANFHDNALAVYTDQDSYDKTKVWRSKFSGNTFDFVSAYNSGADSSDIRYNWWESADGPELCINPDECEPWQTYKKVLGKADVSDWAKEENFKDPVVVIPGIMGSWKWTNSSELKLDPVFGTYNDLLERLDEIKVQTKWPKVDIVAHSMGGLIAREYIGTLNGGSNIDQLITLGTPHDGSPKSYLIWEGGKFSSPSRFNAFDFFANKIFQQEAEEKGYANIFEYIRQAPILSVRELLPIYSYLRDKDDGSLRTYPDLYPINTFLQNLKTSTNINRLAPVTFTNIVGKTNDSETIEEIRVEKASIELLNNPEAIVLWGHGKPDGYDSFFGGDRGLELGSGDGTVPIESAQNITADEIIELQSSHGDLPSDAAKTVVKVLTGSDALSDPGLIYLMDSLLLIMPFSPIDIQIVSPSGKRVGKNFETGGMYDEIPGAYYTGYDTQNEFITVPNPEDGEYQILTEGTGEGDYRIEAVKITEGATPSDDAKESVVSFEGTATQGVMEEKKIELLPDDTVISGDTQDITAPTVDITSPENTTYFNNEQIPVVYVVSDDVSSEDKIAKEVKLDDALFDQASIDLSLHALGSHTFAVRTADEAGNEATQSVTFENTVTFASLNANVDHYFSLGLIKKRGDAKHIHAFLRHLETVQGLLDVLRQTGFFPFKAKDRMIRHLQKERDHKKKELIKYLSKKVEKGKIDPQANNRIVERSEEHTSELQSQSN